MLSNMSGLTKQGFQKKALPDRQNIKMVSWKRELVELIKKRLFGQIQSEKWLQPICECLTNTFLVAPLIVFLILITNQMNSGIGDENKPGAKYTLISCSLLTKQIIEDTGCYLWFMVKWIFSNICDRCGQASENCWAHFWSDVKKQSKRLFEEGRSIWMVAECLWNCVLVAPLAWLVWSNLGWVSFRAQAFSINW